MMEPYDPEPDEAIQREKWEYTFLEFPDPITSHRDWIQVTVLLNRWGEKGWQLVQFINRSQQLAPTSYMAIFKRRKP